MTDKASKDFLEIFKEHDLGIDVHGGNPFSPIWICGMEFRIGVTNFYRFMKNANEEYNLAGDKQLTDSNAGEFEYPRLATELIGCLTDAEILNEYKSAWNEYDESDEDNKQEKLEKFRNISNKLCLKKILLCKWAWLSDECIYIIIAKQQRLGTHKSILHRRGLGKCKRICKGRYNKSI